MRTMCFALCAVWLAIFASGCGETEKTVKAAPPADAEKKKAEDLPKIPESEEGEAGKTEMLIKDGSYGEKRKRDDYVPDEKMSSGNLRGLCVVNVPKGTEITIPAQELISFEGKYAILDPKPGEVDYYKNIKPKTPQYWLASSKPNAAGKIGVWGAVLRARGIKAGKRGQLVRPSYLIRSGNFGASWGSYMWGNYSFGPTNERAHIGTYDSHPCRICVTNIESGKQIYEGDVSSYDAKGIKPLQGGGTEFKKPDMGQTAPLTENGGYKLTCKRHPWQFAYLFIHDNPYVCVVPSHYDAPQVGKFAMDGLPPGKQTIEVWHPGLEPVQKLIEVEIKENETTEITIEFNPPK